MKKVAGILIVIAFLGIGCSKNFLSELQDNPNAPTSGAASPALVLPSTITSIVDITNGGGANGGYEYIGLWMGYWNYAPGYSFNNNPQNYIVSSTTPQVWDNYYGILANLNFIVQSTIDEPKQANYRAIANILEAVCFKNLVDVYNKIPYSQALKAQANFYPGYDDGSAIYDSLVLKLNDAMTVLQGNIGNAEITTPTTDDVMFGGDLSQWILYANTVKLSMLVQQSKVTSKSTYLAAEAAKTASVGYLTTDAMVNPGYSGSQPNPSWANFGVGPSGALNNYFTFVKGNQASIDFYKATNDQRLGYIYSKADAAPTDPDFFNPTLPINPTEYQADYTGTQNQIPGGVSGIGPGIIKSDNASAPMLTAAESYFWQAEATIYGWLPGGHAAAKVLYEQGITASYEFLGVGGDLASADIAAAAYFGQTSKGFVTFPVGESDDSLVHTIIEQRWAAMNSINNSISYNDWRRTFDPAMNGGYPLLPDNVSTTLAAPHMPFRYLYPTEEPNNNGAAWQAAGGNKITQSTVYTDKIFWMP